MCMCRIPQVADVEIECIAVGLFVSAISTVSSGDSRAMNPSCLLPNSPKRGHPKVIVERGYSRAGYPLVSFAWKSADTLLGQTRHLKIATPGTTESHSFF